MQEKSGQNLSRCYQCKKCSGGCPMAFAMDYRPSEVIRMVQLGAKDKLLQSRTIWVCASCKTCKSRCPNDIDTSAVNDALKTMAQAQNTVAESRIAAFHESFLGSLAKHGRIYEAGMLIGFKMKTKTYTEDMQLGMEFFKRGKLKLLPTNISKIREIRRIFQLAKEKK